MFAALYPELRRIAHARLWGERDDSMLGTTMSVHETFLHLVDAAQLAVADRKHFYTYAAKTMRNIIIDLARERVAERRGSGERPLPIDTELAEQLGAADGAIRWFASTMRCSRSKRSNAELVHVVEMRYFAGYSEAEVAELLGLVRAHRAPSMGESARVPARLAARVTAGAAGRVPQAAPSRVRGTGAPASGHPHEG